MQELATPDRHVRRTAEDYREAFAALLPQGTAWPRHPDAVLQSVLLGLAGIWGEGQGADGRAADLLERETDPRATLELLPDWERAFGLPDACLAEPVTIADRHAALVARFTMLGGQSRPFFIALAAAIGYEILIVEHSPFMCGISQVGDTRNWNGEGSPWYRWELSGAIGGQIRFYWTIKVIAPRLTWFRVGEGGGQVGVDPHLRIAIATDLECLMRRYAPAHTALAFDYSGLAPIPSMAGTP